MPKSEPRGSQTRIARDPEANQHGRQRKQVETNQTSETADMPLLRDAPIGGDFSQSTFEQHAALLGDGRLSKPANASVRTQIVQQLQRDYGNKYVQRLVNHISLNKAEERHGESTVPPSRDEVTESDAITAEPKIDSAGSVQRAVLDGRGKPKDTDWVLDKFKDHDQHKEYYELALSLGMNDNSLKEIVAEYVEDEEKDYHVWDVFGFIDDRIAQFGGSADAEFDADVTTNDKVGIKVLSVTPNFAGSGPFKEDPGGESSIGSSMVSVRAKVAVKGADSAIVKQWEVGFFQTVLSLTRKLTWSGEEDGFRDDKTPGPMRDGPAGYPGPWYDAKAKASLGNEFEVADVLLRDQPGWSWKQPKDCKITGVSGQDRFKTWLVFRNKDTKETHYLRMWEWAVNYSEKEGGVVKYDGESADDGAQAVTGGTTAKEFLNK